MKSCSQNLIAINPTCCITP